MKFAALIRNIFDLVQILRYGHNKHDFCSSDSDYSDDSYSSSDISESESDESEGVNEDDFINKNDWVEWAICRFEYVNVLKEEKEWNEGENIGDANEKL